jgi:glycosyltransferase involved in cell wall biosynthesis
MSDGALLLDRPGAGAAATAACAARRVLFVHQSSDLYGSDRVLHDIALTLRRAGGEPIVALPEGGPLVGCLRTQGVETHALPAARLLKLSRRAMSPRGLLQLALTIPSALSTIDEVVAGRAIDLVHSNTLAVVGGALWSRARSVPHLWHVHEMVEHPRLAAWALPLLVRLLAERVACNSSATREWLATAQPALRRRSRVFWNGSALGAGAGVSVPDPTLVARFRPQGQRLAVGLVGRINRMKGHAVLLDAAERLHAQGRRDFSIVFIGNAPPGQPQHEHELRRRVAVSPLSAGVVLAGFMSDVVGAMRALDIVCVPSTEAEAFGLVAVEAMAAARPVLASTAGGLAEVIGHSGAGLLHPPGDAATLAAQLAALLDDAALRARMGRAGAARHAAHFTAQATGERMLGLFEGLELR